MKAKRKRKHSALTLFLRRHQSPEGLKREKDYARFDGYEFFSIESRIWATDVDSQEKLERLLKLLKDNRLGYTISEYYRIHPRTGKRTLVSRVFFYLPPP